VDEPASDDEDDDDAVDPDAQSEMDTGTCACLPFLSYLVHIVV